jgi:hypothetical protein
VKLLKFIYLPFLISLLLLFKKNANVIERIFGMTNWKNGANMAYPDVNNSDAIAEISLFG